MKRRELMERKKLFYAKMKVFFDEGIVREVYSDEYICILNFGNYTYIACLMLALEEDESPLGLTIFDLEKTIQNHMENPSLIYRMTKEALTHLDKYGKLLISFSESEVKEKRSFAEERVKSGECYVLDETSESKIKEQYMKKQRKAKAKQRKAKAFPLISLGCGLTCWTMLILLGTIIKISKKYDLFSMTVVSAFAVCGIIFGILAGKSPINQRDIKAKVGIGLSTFFLFIVSLTIYEDLSRHYYLWIN